MKLKPHTQGRPIDQTRIATINSIVATHSGDSIFDNAYKLALFEPTDPRQRALANEALGMATHPTKLTREVCDGLTMIIRGADTSGADSLLSDVLAKAPAGSNLAALTTKHAGAAITVRRLLGSFGLLPLALTAIGLGGQRMAMRLLLAGYEAHGSWHKGITDLLGLDTLESIVAEAFAARTHLGGSVGTTVQRRAYLNGWAASHLRSGGQFITSPHPFVDVSPAPATTATTVPATTLENPVMTTATTSTVNTVNTTHSAITALTSIPGQMRSVLDAALAAAAPGSGLNLSSVQDALNELAGSNANLLAMVSEARDEAAAARTAARTAAANAKPSGPMTLPQQQTGPLVLPSGKVEEVSAVDLFPCLEGKIGKSFKVPQFTWDTPHPDVPGIVAGYIFRPELLIPSLVALASGSQNLWLRGHTGSGKTTLIAQIAAILRWPLMRVAMDGNVDRSALLGRMQMKGGSTEWLVGSLEIAQANGYILLLDELDAAHNNSIYVVQSLLEGEGLRILEDGGRQVTAHPYARVGATGNSGGNGDDTGLYPAVRALSAATLDRFGEMVEVPYMSMDEELTLLKTKVPALSDEIANRIAKFAHEMRNAFVNREVMVSFSPRRSVAMADSFARYVAIGIKEDVALALVARGKVLVPAPEENKQRISELIGTALDADVNLSV